MTSIKYPRRKGHEIVINLNEKRETRNATFGMSKCEEEKKKIGKYQAAMPRQAARKAQTNRAILFVRNVHAFQFCNYIYVYVFREFIVREKKNI